MKNSSRRNLNAKIRKCLALTAICLSPISYAAPFTYQFTQSYSFSDSPSYFGSAAVFDVTVDNGNSSNVSQAYTWNNILSLNITTIGGGFVLSTAYPPDYGYYDPGSIQIYKTAATDNTVIFNTDATGTNAFFVPTSQNESFSQYRVSYYRASLSARLGAGAFHALDLYDIYTAPYMMGESIVYNAYVDSFSPNLTGILVANPISPQIVPIPASGWMLISGLIALGSSRRKKAGSTKHIDQKARTAIFLN